MGRSFLKAKLFNIFQDTNNLKALFVGFVGIISAILGLFIHKNIISIYGNTTFEFYTLAISWMVLTSNVYLLGSRLNYLVISNDKKMLSEYFIGSLFLSLILSIIFAFIINVILTINHNSIIEDYKSHYLILLFIFHALSSIISFYLNAIRKPLLSKVSITLPSIFFIIFLFFNPSKNLFFYIYNSFFLSSLIFIFLIIKINPFNKVAFHSIALSIKQNIKPGLIFSFTSLIDIFSNKIAVFFFVYIITDIKFMICTSIAFAFSRSALIGINSINHVYTKDIVDYPSASSDIFFKKIQSLSFLISLAILILFVLIGRQVIIYFYTEEYIEAYMLTIILLSGQLIHSFFNPYSIFLKVKGSAIKSSFSKLLFTVLMVFANYFLYDYFGIDLIAYNYVFFIYIIWNLYIYHSFNDINKRAHSSIG